MSPLKPFGLPALTIFMIAGGCVPLDVGDLPTGAPSLTETQPPSSPTSSPTSPLSPSAPPSPTPSLSPTLSAIPTPTPTPTPAPTPTSLGTPTPTPSPTITGSIPPTLTPSLSPSPSEPPSPTEPPTATEPPTPTRGADNDSDGVALPFDCDDRDPATFPGAEEACNGKDNDCDSSIDEGDRDGDGAPTCPLPGQEADCDDSEPLASPLYDYEYFDGIDNTCDGFIDSNQDPSGARWVLDGPREEEFGWCGSAMGSVGDLNRDGFGDFIVTCPRATGVDQGVSYVFFGSGKRFETPVDTSTLILEGDFNYALGGSAFASGDFNGDGSVDLVIGQPGWSRISLLLGPLDPRGEALSLRFLGKTGNGEFLASAGAALAMVDLDGDGRAEMVVGSPTAESFRGRTTLIPGGQQLPNDFEIEDVGRVLPKAFIYPDTPPVYGGEGSALAAIGDFDGDGFEDVAVGSFYAGGTSDSSGEVRPRAGAIEILYGGDLDEIGRGDRRLVISGVGESNFGASLAGAGDVNGDGIADIVVGAPRADVPAKNGGRGYVIAGGARLTGALFVEELGERVLGTVRCNREDCQLGTLYNTQALGDINGDGYGDLAFGAVGYATSEGGQEVRDRGAIGVFLGSAAPWGGNRDLFSADAFFLGTRADDKLGALGPVGDLDGDGFDELLLGAFEAQVDPGFAEQDTGRAYLFWGYGRRPMGVESSIRELAAPR